MRDSEIPENTVPAINNINDLKQFLEEISQNPINHIQSQISALSRSQIFSMIANILAFSNKTNIASPNDKLEEIRKFWEENTGAVEGGSELDGNRRQYILDTFRYGIEGYLQEERGIDLENIVGFKERSNAFVDYLNTMSSQNISPVMLQICTLTNLLCVEQNVEKIKQTLTEFPPSAEYLACLDGALERTEWEVLLLAVPKYAQQFLDAYEYSIRWAVEVLKIDFTEGEHIHIKPFLEYCFGFIPQDKIRDRLFNLPNDKADPLKFAQVIKDFPDKFKDFFIKQYKDGDAFINAVEIYESGASWSAIQSIFATIGIEDMEHIVSENQDYRSPNSLNWGEFVRQAHKIKQKKYKNFNTLFEEHLKQEMVSPPVLQSAIDIDDNLSVSSMSDSKETTTPSTKDRITEITTKLFDRDINIQLEGLDLLWALGHLKNNSNDPVLFIRAIYEVGKLLNSKLSDGQKLQKQYFNNIEAFLCEFHDKIPEEQKFKVNFLLAKLHEKELVTAAHYQHSSLSAFSPDKIGVDMNVDEQRKTVFLFALHLGFEKAVEKMVHDFKDANDRSLFDVNEVVDIDKNTPLHIAAYNGYKKLFLTLLDLGADVNVKNNQGITPLIFACSNAQVEIIDSFHNVNFDIVDNNGDATVHYAARIENAEVIKKLINNGANLNVTDARKRTSLVVALQNNNLNVANAILESHEQLDVNIISAEGKTALTIAVSIGDINIIKELVNRGADINFQNLEGVSILRLAVMGGKHDVVEFLLQNGADVNNVSSVDGDTALHCAAEYDNANIVNLLLDNGAKINTTNKEGDTPLHRACLNNGFNATEYLVARGADKGLVNYEGATAICFAITDRNKKIVKFLLDSGVDINAEIEDGGFLSALNYAFCNANAEMARFLLENGARLDQVIDWNKHSFLSDIDEDQHTPESIDDTKKLIRSSANLFECVNKDKIKSIKNLIGQDGAAINAKDSNGKTILDIAREKGREKIVKLLEATIGFVQATREGDTQLVKQYIDNGAIINALDEDGNKALRNACIQGNVEMVRLLIENGSDIFDAADIDGALKLDIDNEEIKNLVSNTAKLLAAAANGDQQIIDELVAKGAILNVKYNNYTAQDLINHDMQNSGNKRKREDGNEDEQDAKSIRTDTSSPLPLFGSQDSDMSDASENESDNQYEYSQTPPKRKLDSEYYHDNNEDKLSYNEEDDYADELPPPSPKRPKPSTSPASPNMERNNDDLERI